MALVAKRSRRTMILMIFLAIVVVGGLGYFFLPKLFSNSGETTEIDVGVRDLPIVNNFGSDVLTDPRFIPLRTYGDPLGDIDLNRVGRPNPFAPLL